MMKLLIHVKKEHYRKAMYCGTNGDSVSQNCAVALAVRELFPMAAVCKEIIVLDKSSAYCSVDLPVEAIDMISVFDVLKSTPEQRLDLPEFSFEIEVPEQVIMEIGIGQVYKILSESSNLELVR